MKEVSQLQLHWIDGTIIAVYVLLLLGVGIYHSRKTHNLADFFLAGSNIKWLAGGLSLMAALNSGVDFLMQPASIIKFGTYILVGSLSWVVLIPYVWHVALPVFRKVGGISVYEYLEHRFDLRVRVLAATIFILWRTGWMATAIYVPSLALSVATGGRLQVHLVVIAIGLVVTFYTMMGGMRAVIWNDVLQFWIMLAGVLTAVAICTINVEGGIGTIVGQLAHVGDQVQDQVPAGVPEGWLSYFYIPMTYFGFFFAVTLNRISTYTTDQVMVQRFKTMKTIADARRGFLITAITDTIWMVTLAFVGLALFAYFKYVLGQLPPWAMDKPDQLLPYFMSLVFPIGFTGLVIAAIFAASVSSIDSALTAITSVVTVDFVQRLYLNRNSKSGADAPPRSAQRQVFLSRFITVVVGVIGIGIGLNVAALGSLLEISMKLVNSFSGPMLGIYLLGMFSRRANASGALFGGIIGTFVTLYVAFQSEIHRTFDRFSGAAPDPGAVISYVWAVPAGCFATCAIGYLASFAGRQNEPGIVGPWLWTGVMRREEPETR